MTTEPVLDANGDVVRTMDGPLRDVEVPDDFRRWMAGRVPVACGHYIAASEARAGFTNCEACQ